MKIDRSGERATSRGDAAWFTGTVWQDPIVAAPEPARVRAVRVAFEPGARTNWHTHPLGQTLYVIAGVGRVQSEGGPVKEIRSGDVVWIEPNARHWHGASPTNGMTHIAIQEALDGRHIAWEEPVTEADYAVEASADG